MKRLLMMLAATGLLSACAGPVVQYGDAKGVETVTNEFGSTDLQTIAEAMSRSMALSDAFATRNGHKPRLTISPVKNKTSELIDTNAILNTIRVQVAKSGRATFVTNISEMSNQVDELQRQNQSGLYKQDSVKKLGNMTGADLRVDGEITSIVKETKNIKDVYYKFSLQLFDVSTGEMVWADEKDIRKQTKR